MCAQVSYKNVLQERCQKSGGSLPTYDTKTLASGATMSFVCTVYAFGQNCTGGVRKTKQDAEQNAAKRMLYKLGDLKPAEVNLDNALAVDPELSGFNNCVRNLLDRFRSSFSSTIEIMLNESLNRSEGISKSLSVEYGEKLGAFIAHVDESSKSVGKRIEEFDAKYTNLFRELQSNVQQLSARADIRSTAAAELLETLRSDIRRVESLLESGSSEVKVKESQSGEQIFIRLLDGSTCSYDVLPYTLISAIKWDMARKLNIPSQNLTLQFRGKVLEDSKTVSEYGIQQQDFLNLLGRIAGGAKGGKSGKKEVKKEEKKIEKEVKHIAKTAPQAVSVANKLKHKAEKKARTAASVVRRDLDKIVQRQSIMNQSERRPAGLTNAKRFLMSVVSPGMEPPERLAMSFDDTPTAVTSLKAQYQCEFTNAANIVDSDSTVLAPPELGATVGFKFRHPIRNTVTYKMGTTGFTYEAYIGYGSEDGTTAPAPNAGMMISSSETPIDVRWIQYVNGDMVHGPLMGVGFHPRKPELRFLWWDGGGGANDKWQLTLIMPSSGGVVGDMPAPSFTGYSLNINIYRLNKVEVGDAFEQLHPAPFTPGSTNIVTITNNSAGDPLPAGYYAYTMHWIYRTDVAPPARKLSTPSSSSLPLQPLLPGVDASEPVVSCPAFIQLKYVRSSDANQPLWAHRMLPDLENNIYSTQQIRTIGSSSMVSQRGAAITAQGNIAQIQAMKGQNWTDYVSGGYSALADLKGADSGRSITKGAYCFTKPLDMKDFGFIKSWQTENSNIRFMQFPLLPEDGFLVQYVVTNQPTGGGPTVPPPAMIWTFWTSIEFETQNQIFDTRVGQAPEGLIEAGFRRIKTITQYHDNESHLNKIFRNVMDFGKKVMGTVNGLTSGVTGQLAEEAAFLGGLLG